MSEVLKSLPGIDVDRALIDSSFGSALFELSSLAPAGVRGNLVVVETGSPLEAVHQIEREALAQDPSIPKRAIRQTIVECFDLVIHMHSFGHGKEKVLSISSLEGLSGELIPFFQIWRYQENGATHIATGQIPNLVEKLIAMGKKIPAEIFQSK